MSSKTAQSRLLLLLPTVFALCLLMHCSSAPHPQAAAPKVEWYVALREPLTYCPVGHKLPVPDTAAARGAEYVYLADRTTRFHIPPGCMAHRQAALELREDSKSAAGKFLTSTENTMAWIGGRLAGAVRSAVDMVR